MFKKLTEYSYKRSALEAIGFYIAYLILIMLLAGILAGVLGIATGNENNFQFGVRVGATVAIIVSTGLSLVILYKKKLHTNFILVIVGLLSGLLAAFAGGMLGLIPTAYLTTRLSAGSTTTPVNTPPPEPSTVVNEPSVASTVTNQQAS